MKTTSMDMTTSPKFLRQIFPLLCLIFLLGSPIANAQDFFGNVSFQTPEEAITFYMQGVIEGDISKVMQATAVDEMSENFRFDLYVDRIRVVPFVAPAPSDYAFYTELNKAQFSWQILSQTRNLVYGLLATEKGLAEGETIRLLEPDEATAFVTLFIAELDPERLAGLEVVTMGVPYPEIVETERLQENWRSQAAIYGADELTERVVLIQFEGAYYYIGFNLLRYGENWKINYASSVISGISTFGAPTPTTEEEFQDMVDGE